MIPPKFNHLFWQFLCLFVLIANPCSAGDSAQQIEERIQNANPEEKERLARNVKEFRKLDAAKQERLLKLQSQIDSHPESTTLVSILENFHAWFEKLPAEERVRFHALTKDDERIAFIREGLNRQRREQLLTSASTLSPQDEEAIFTWVSGFALKHKARFMNVLPPEIARKLEAVPDETKRGLALTCLLFMKRMNGPGLNLLRPGRDDFEKLRPTLSAEARQLLESQPDEHDRMFIVHNWVLAVLWKKAIPDSKSVNLEKFEANLPALRKEQLTHLPPPEREKELRTMYIMASLIGFRPGEWSDQPGPEEPFQPPSFFGFGKGAGPRPERFEGKGPPPEGKAGEPRPKPWDDFMRDFMEPSPNRPPPGKK